MVSVRVLTLSVLTTLLVSCVLAGNLPSLGCAILQQGDSDWWSGLRRNQDEVDIKTERRTFTESNFRILGIELAETMFAKANERLGVAATVQRGDASSGRTQACYVSAPNKERVHLIFEQGEVDFGFYLFAGGAAWDGSERCLVSDKISPNVGTGSGVRLGQTRGQVIAILGRPTKESKNVLTYAFSVRKKASPEDLRQARHHHPELDDKELLKEFGFYDLNAGVIARFEQGKLRYLAVSKSETN